MSDAREVILGRIRGALADVPPAERPEDVPVAREYARHGDLSGEALVERFAERVRDYNAEVRRVASDGVAAAVAEACAGWGLTRVAVPTGWPARWRPADVELIGDAGLTAHALDDINAAVTGCAVAIAETGTLILDGQAASGRRVLTLVPDHHICIVTADQIAGTVPEAVAALGPAVREQRAPITFISGPSASSDIELSRVEGVHGPRHLLVVIAGDG
ncbi:MAG TPA: LUD domain-containing protein [Solirubrobacteraceae bacterium]|nr:LUD domain-containing protein [Solirubrobacteraceae bacterium]